MQPETLTTEPAPADEIKATWEIERDSETLHAFIHAKLSRAALLDVTLY